MKRMLLVGVVVLSLMLSSLAGFAATKQTTSCKTKAKAKCVATASHKRSTRTAKKCVTAAKTRSAAKCATKHTKKAAKKA